MMSVDCGRPRVHRANFDRHSLGHLELSAGPVTGRLAEVTNALATVADRNWLLSQRAQSAECSPDGRWKQERLLRHS